MRFLVGRQNSGSNLSPVPPFGWKKVFHEPDVSELPPVPELVLMVGTVVVF